MVLTLRFQATGETPVSELLEEEIKALKFGETQLDEQNAKLIKDLEKLSLRSSKGMACPDYAILLEV